MRVAFPKAVLTEKNRGWLKDWYIWVEGLDDYQFKLVEKHPGWIVVQVPSEAALELREGDSVNDQDRCLREELSQIKQDHLAGESSNIVAERAYSEKLLDQLREIKNYCEHDDVMCSCSDSMMEHARIGLALPKPRRPV